MITPLKEAIRSCGVFCEQIVSDADVPERYRAHASRLLQQISALLPTATESDRTIDEIVRAIEENLNRLHEIDALLQKLSGKPKE
jgi:uncharacterized protein YigA (DUF484 family)